MDEQTRLNMALDEHEIGALLVRWGHARDSDDWETLAGCFHDGATIHISWISAPATEFVAGSQAMATRRQAGSHLKHVFSGPWIKVAGARAFSRCHVNLVARAEVDGYWFDLQSWFRFFDLLEKRDGRWGIVKRTGVYEKDRMDPVVPGSVPASYFADMDFSGLAPEAKYLLWRQRKQGRPSAPDMVTVMSAGEAAARVEGEAWLEGG